MAFDPRAKFLITASTDFRKADRNSKRFFSSLKKNAKVAVAALAVAATAGAVAILRLASNAAKAADALAKQSDILGISTQKLAAFQLAARLSGSTNEGFEKGIRKLQKAIIDATFGLTTYTRAFDALKLDPQELKKLTPDKQFEALGKAFAGVTNQVERVAIAFDLFGGRNTALLNTLLITGTQLNQIERDTKAWGVALTRIDAKQIENANDAIERAKTATLGIGTNIALAASALREDLANAFADSAAEAQGFRSEIQATMEALVVGANFASNAIRGIQLAFLGTKIAALKIQESIISVGAPSKKGPPKPAFGVPNAQAQAQFRSLGLLKDSDKQLDKIRAGIDETGQSIDALIGKFQSGDVALATFRKLQEDAVARAKAQIQSLSDRVVEEEPFELSAERINQITKLKLDIAFRNAKRAISKTNTELNEFIATQEKADKAALDLGFTFSSMFEDAIVNGKRLQDVFKGLLQDIIRISLRTTITNPLGKALSGVLGGLFGGGKAAGGPVSSGTTFLVGERGPELFTSRNAGTIIPNNKLGIGGGGGFNQTNNFSVAFPVQLEALIRNIAAPVAADTALKVIQATRGRI